ncbi:hypothetical protein SAMN04487881_2178 [Marinobacter sp. es.048]|uniref:hypothetical protein n=1 Tax=Marinobacter sp. es.048 TaxID=1761795 RepID=UPI000B592FD2|nr:hypothetical protein [Marinobacter sp. es.048]SNC68112.1 hypothetical protein SAMN04487881_2178 [Marinobacter sp. es.048]
MLDVKRSSLSALLMGFTATMVGCSDYPGDGVLDTKMVREFAEIIEVEGNVYGIKKGALDAYRRYSHDRSALKSAESIAWDAYQEGEGVPKIELQYEGDRNGFDLDAFQSALDTAVTEAAEKAEAEIAEDIAEAQARRAELIVKIEEISKGGEKFDAYVADAKSEYEAAQKALDNAIDAYNAEIERPLTTMNEIAEANGLEKASSRLNPIRSYRKIDFSNRAMPSSCPSQRGYTSVNLLREQKTCGYIRLASRFEPYAGEIVKATKAALINIPNAKTKMGEKGGWGSDGTGAYAAVEVSEDAYKERLSEARSKFGNDSQRKRQVSYLEDNLERLDNQIADYKGENHRGYVMRQTYPELPANIDKSADKYIDGMYQNLVGYIEKGPEITMAGKNAEFSGFSGDYEGGVTVADFIVNENGRRKDYETINYLDLTIEAVKTADVLTFELDRDGFSDGRRIDIREPDTIEEAIIKQLREQERERRRGGNA